MNKKLEDPNNVGHYTLLRHSGTVDSVVFNQFGILQMLSERDQRQYDEFVKHFPACTDIDDLGLIDWYPFVYHVRGLPRSPPKKTSPTRALQSLVLNLLVKLRTIQKKN